MRQPKHQHKVRSSFLRIFQSCHDHGEDSESSHQILAGMASQEECRVGTNHSAAYRSRSEWIITDDDTDTRVERAAGWRHTE